MLGRYSTKLSGPAFFAWSKRAREEAKSASSSTDGALREEEAKSANSSGDGAQHEQAVPKKQKKEQSPVQLEMNALRGTMLKEGFAALTIAEKLLPLSEPQASFFSRQWHP